MKGGGRDKQNTEDKHGIQNTALARVKWKSYTYGNMYQKISLFFGAMVGNYFLAHVKRSRLLSIT